MSSEGEEDVILLDIEQSNMKIFRTICGASTFWIPEIEPETIYKLDNNVPTLLVP